MEGLLKDSLRCHLTMDMWSNKMCKESFFGVTVVYLTKNENPGKVSASALSMKT